MTEDRSATTREWKRLVEEFQKKSDRAVAILGTTYLNTHLANLLECFLIDDEKIAKMLLGEENPLGSFEARIKAAYGFGLISRTEYHDLVLIWHIRNRFIRDMGEGSFMEMDTQNLCKRLKIPDEVILQEEDPTPRHLFVFGTAILAQQLMYRANEANLEKREPRDNFILVNIE
ncbi:MAG: MltR family transcriptional regulator [Anaerolineales bacterium]|jgi:DNA-binding MltR family transcriptional regulator